ncbi:hypothetical protein OsI_21327 [Oryza sativa Indica Group]|uniref:Uncharacterized protein n=1 Tax=Oryza sativa subsp. indica TaxID=39946 RepID=B8B1J1_ORYSI|nr:hypothetical protein OsI_21327 [Oryza sativa Indica Group]
MISPLIRKLGDLLLAELGLDKRTRKGIESLQRELTMMHAAMHKVAEVPPEQLDPVVRVWARQVRELSYDMEDAVDTYMVRIGMEEDHIGHPAANLKNKVKKFVKKTSRLFRKGKDLRQIVGAVGEAQDLAKQWAELRQRYGSLELHGANAAGVSTINPRLTALYKDDRELIGIDATSNELIEMILASDGSENSLKTVSVVGMGGLGKTTLARAVYDRILRSHFDCGAFVSIGRNPDMNKVFKDMLYGLDKEKYGNIHNTTRDETQLIDQVRSFIKHKRYAAILFFFLSYRFTDLATNARSNQIDTYRYFIVIDDIWNEKIWEFVKCALPENNLGNRIVTTTRIVSVSDKCCATHHGIYKMKPLSSEDSETLFYKRIFTDGKECPQYLLRLSKDILKKCAGVPLAITSIASLLANKKVQSEEQWSTVLKSIGRGMTEGGTVDDMRKILSLSYHDLPSHLKACLLYMSVFPEDHNIRRDRLIWTWIAQGFVQCKEEENSLFELGECCLNELVNRSMVQLLYSYSGIKQTCRLHDIVLDLISSASTEENFVSTPDDVGQSTCLQSKVRRLSLLVQDCRVEHTSPLATIDLSHVRSFTGFRTAIKLIPSLSRFHVLRVLDLEDCVFRSSGRNLSHVSKLFHLRYLGLRCTQIGELPIGLGKLRFLQVLDLENAEITELPSDVTQLEQLRGLYVDFSTRLPKGMAHLKFVEALSRIDISQQHPSFVRVLRNMTGLRELKIRWVGSADNRTKYIQETLVESLSKLNKIQTLTILSNHQESLDVLGECWVVVAPPNLRRFELHGLGYFSRMPVWIKRDPLLLTELSVLSINFNRRLLQADDMQILSMLPVLAYLTICAPSERMLIGPGFRCLRRFHFWNITEDGVVVFGREAMPSVERIRFNASVRKMIDDGSYETGLGLGNLLSLKEADISLLWTKAKVQEVEQVEAALMRAIRDHPNQVTISINS